MWQGRRSSHQEKTISFSQALVRLWGPVSEGQSAALGAGGEAALPCSLSQETSVSCLMEDMALHGAKPGDTPPCPREERRLCPVV